MTEAQTLREQAAELLAAIDRRWEGESQRKRENAVSPRMEDAMEALRKTLAAKPDPYVERMAAESDADLYGTGFMVDGFRVEPSRIKIIGVKP